MEVSSENQALVTEAEAELDKLDDKDTDEDSPLVSLLSTKKISVDSGVNMSGNKAEADSDEIDGYSEEMQLLQTYFHKLLVAIEPEINDLCLRLYSVRKIGYETKSKVIDSENKPTSEKSALLLKDIEHRVMVDPQFLIDVLIFFEQETSDPLRGLATDMKTELGLRQVPRHSLSESTVLPRRRQKVCFQTAASSPAAFAPQLSTMCEHCELQHQALFTMFEKFCQDYLKASIGLNPTEGETEDETNDTHTHTLVNGDVHSSYDSASQTEQYPAYTQSQPDSLGSLTAAIPDPPASLESTDSHSGPRSLEVDPSLFQASPSISRQCSYNSCGGDENLTKITTDFLERLKSYHRQQKRQIIHEKKKIKEKLARTEEEYKELFTQRHEGEKELEEAREEIYILKQSLDDAQVRISQLNKEVIRNRKQLMTEKCINGNSVDCKHFVRASALEEENKKLTRQRERLEDDNKTYRLKIENLELRVEELMKMLVEPTINKN